MSNMMIFNGNANLALAQSIAEHLKTPLGKTKVGRFSDGEIMIEVCENVRGHDVFIVQSTCAPTNDNLMELLLLADAIKRSSANRVTAVIPYFGYARQDRRPRSARVPISAKVVANMLHTAGIDRMLTVDLHADQIQGFFDFPVDNAYSSAILLDDIQAKQISNVTVVSPDVGGVARARAFAKRIKSSELAIIDKRRPKPNEAKIMHIIGNVKDKNCILVDDMVDTAGSLCVAAEALKKEGANRVVAYCTHPVLSGKALENIKKSPLDELVITDTIPLTTEAQAMPKIRQLSLASILSEAIRRVSREESLSSMFSN